MTMKQANKVAEALRKRGYKAHVNVEVKLVPTATGVRVVENYYVR